MLQGGQTPSWTCQMVFNPAHCPRSSAPFSSLSLHLLSYSGMFTSFCSPPLLPAFLPIFTSSHTQTYTNSPSQLLFSLITHSSHISFFLFLSLLFFFHTALSPPGISLFSSPFSSLYFFSPRFFALMAHGHFYLTRSVSKSTSHPCLSPPSLVTHIHKHMHTCKVVFS